MSPASPSIPSSDSRPKWRKRKRDSNLKRQKPLANDEDEDEAPPDELAGAPGDDAEDGFGGGEPLVGDPVLDLRETEVLSDAGYRISDFPAAFRRSINRPHPSVIAIVAAERAASSLAAPSRPWNPPFLENISHGQLQALSVVLPDNPSLQKLPDFDKPSAYVCTPPPLMEGKGLKKRFDKDQLLLVPVHSDWFSVTTVHRLERQVVPNFFSGKEPEHTPERYISLRNRIIGKYLENPGRKLTLADCQGLVPNNELIDLNRIVRFLNHWGIINYFTASSVPHGLRLAEPLLREEVSGELQLQTSPLRSDDSLILFDRPKCSRKLEDTALLSNSNSSVRVDFEGAIDLDSRIREQLAEHSCNYCSRPLPQLHYQSQKEADVMLCLDCFHDAKFVTGHSSLDFLRVDSRKDNSDADGDNWTDEETLLLLEAVEKYSDNWNEIAEHVSTKSRAQCILHFLRLPMEDNLLENIELPHKSNPSNKLNGHDSGFQNSNSNGDVSEDGQKDFDSSDQIPFENSANPVMSMVAFLTSAIGPRVAAACANAALSVLTKGDSSMVPFAPKFNVSDGTQGGQMLHAKRDGNSPLTREIVNYAAMCGLTAAAMKAKLFADQEEREIQRLSVTIINNKLKRLELKLKQFAEVETLLQKECEQAERMRQRLSAEKVRMMSARFGQAGSTLPAAGGGPPLPAAAVAAAVAAANNPTIRPPTMPTSAPAQSNMPNMPPAFANSIAAHNQMQFLQRQQQMFSYGPRLPLSAIHPSAAGPSQGVVFNSATANASNHHPMLRSPSGNNPNVG